VNGATVGHGLGKVPKLIIVKCRYTGTTQSWAVYHSATGATQYLLLNSTAAAATLSTYWNNTAPTSSVFTLGTHNDVNINSTVYTYVAYCFAEIPGFSKIGSYVGNGNADGPFVFCGFRPRWVLVKAVSGGTQPWCLMDTARDTYNQMTLDLYPNYSNAEAASVELLDVTANGFKIRSSVNNNNMSGVTFLFIAFAESPFKFANAR
jgi:hypothetical protein